MESKGTLTQETLNFFKQIEEKIAKMIIQWSTEKKKNKSLTTMIVASTLKSCLEGKLWDFTIDCIVDYASLIDAQREYPISCSDYIEICRDFHLSTSWLVYDSVWGQFALSHPQAQKICQALSIKAGGSNLFVQWKSILHPLRD